jgi:hypothetical protein
MRRSFLWRRFEAPLLLLVSEWKVRWVESYWRQVLEFVWYLLPELCYLKFTLMESSRTGH